MIDMIIKFLRAIKCRGHRRLTVEVIRGARFDVAVRRCLNCPDERILRV